MKTMFLALVILVTAPAACKKQSAKAPGGSAANQTARRSPKPSLPVPIALTIDQITSAPDDEVE